jgi:hypothetical protein
MASMTSGTIWTVKRAAIMATGAFIAFLGVAASLPVIILYGLDNGSWRGAVIGFLACSAAAVAGGWIYEAGRLRKQ